MQNNTNRLESLDILRGFTVFGMILVNNPGSWGFMYPMLRHAKWNGCTLADLVFPFFLFIVGVSINFSLSPKKEEPMSKIYFKIIKRTLILFFLGLILQGFPDYNFAEIRIPGVLQRIAVVYFFSSLLFLNLKEKSLWIVFFGILILYTFVFLFITPPGQIAPNMDPEKNISAYIDNLFLKGHLWKVTKTYDPEGILSTLPAIATAISGILVGFFLKKYSQDLNGGSYLTKLTIMGFVFIILGLFLDPIFPINKNLWTSSYVLFTSGVAILVFALLTKLTTNNKDQIFKKNLIYFYMNKILSILFTPFGLNALFLYFISGIIARLLNIITITKDTNAVSLKIYIYSGIFGKYSNTEWSSFAWSLLFLSFLYILGQILFKFKIFIKI